MIKQFGIIKMKIIVLAFFSTVICVLAQDCIHIDFGNDSTVCECNSTYCDYYPDPQPPIKGKFIRYITSKAGKRLERHDGNFSNERKHSYVVKIDSSKHYQVMEGFGGAFTDAAGINIMSLSSASQNNLMRSYFGKNGSKYNFGRVPIGGTDFSKRPYTYDDTPGDIELKNFSLANEDYEYKMPLMKKALELNPLLRFISASWTAPPWMKSNKHYNGFGYLLNEHYQHYANYIIKFLEEYKKNGFEIWAISTGNEPFTALVPISHINTMFWSARTASKWVIENLGPTLQKSSSNSTKILMLDDQRLALPWYMMSVKNNYANALKYVSGIGIHWYTDELIPATVLDSTHELLPDKFLLITEFSVGDRPWEFTKVILGSWSRAERLIKKLFENINHWVVGWIDWNLALDTKGGPNWVNNNVDASIIIDPEKDVFYKQPMYYAMAHFSKFIPPSSVRIDTKNTDNSVLSTAFSINNSQIVVVLYNTNKQPKNITVVDNEVGYMNLELPAYSLHTFLYKNE